ncbi:MAG: sugar-binding protein, partial [Armatimonadota bacterium]|nr:sugar-binding protein [Armatimonadota bacterium]
RKVDGLAISCNEPQALKAAIDKAVDAGIPTITFDSDSPQSKRATFFGTDNYQGGLRAAELLAKEMGGKGTVALLTGVIGADNLEARIRGFKEGLKKYPGMRIVTTVPCNDDVAEAVRQIRDVQRAQPGLGGWFLVGGWPLFVDPPGAFEGLKPGQVKVVSFDTLEPQLKYVRQGLVQALVGQKYYAWGYESVKILKGLHEGKTYPPFVDSGLDIVTAANVAEFEAKWRSGKF